MLHKDEITNISVSSCGLCTAGSTNRAGGCLWSGKGGMLLENPPVLVLVRTR